MFAGASRIGLVQAQERIRTGSVLFETGAGPTLTTLAWGEGGPAPRFADVRGRGRRIDLATADLRPTTNKPGGGRNENDHLIIGSLLYS
jgi:hypothetical protein